MYTCEALVLVELILNEGNHWTSFNWHSRQTEVALDKGSIEEDMTTAY